MRKSVPMLLILVALGAAGAVAAASFSDPAGDSYGPDITKVDAEVEGGALVVDVAFGNRDDGLEGSELAEIDLDLDGNDKTGDDGIDLYAVYEGDQPSEVLRFEKDDYVDTNLAQATKDAEGVHLRVPLSLVGRQVEVAAQAIAAPPPDQDPDDPPPPPPTLPDTDNAPNTGAYSVAIPAATLRRASVSFTPAQPRAGKPFKVRSVSVVLSSGGPFPATATCAATLAGKKLAPSGSCAWRVPKDARGKPLRVTVTAAFAGSQFKLPAKTFRVR